MRKKSSSCQRCKEHLKCMTEGKSCKVVKVYVCSEHIRQVEAEYRVGKYISVGLQEVGGFESRETMRIGKWKTS